MKCEYCKEPSEQELCDTCTNWFKVHPQESYRMRDDYATETLTRRQISNQNYWPKWWAKNREQRLMELRAYNRTHRDQINARRRVRRALLKINV